MPKNDRIRLRHALEAGQKAVKFLEGAERKALDNDEKLALSVVRLLEIVGEAATHIDPKFKGLHPEIPWRASLVCAIG